MVCKVGFLCEESMLAWLLLDTAHDDERERKPVSINDQINNGFYRWP